MTTWVRVYLRSRIGALLAVCVLFAATGCVAGHQAPQFGPMPQIGVQEKGDYSTLLGPKLGRGSGKFSFDARASIAVWLGCIGKGTVWMTRPIAVGATCGSGNSFAGGTLRMAKYEVGHKVAVDIVGPASVRWEFRIDGSP